MAGLVEVVPIILLASLFSSCSGLVPWLSIPSHTTADRTQVSLYHADWPYPKLCEVSKDCLQKGKVNSSSLKMSKQNYMTSILLLAETAGHI